MKIEVNEALKGTVKPASETADGQAKFRIRIIAGDVQGSSGYYPAEVIKRDGPTAFPRGTHMHLDHQSFMEMWEKPAGSLNDLVGVIDSTPEYVEGDGLFADALVFGQWAPMLKEMAPYIGVSIRAAAASEPGVINGEQTEVITSIEAGLSVDYVTHPGAKGRIVEILESAKPESLPPGLKVIAESSRPASEAGKPKKGNVVEISEEALKALAESTSSLVTLLTAQATQRAEAEEAQRKAAEEGQRVDIPTIVRTAVEALSASKLPAAAQNRVLAEVSRGVALTEAIKTETEYLELVKAETVAEAGSGTGMQVFGTGTSGGAATFGNYKFEAGDPTKMLEAWNS